MPSPNPPPVSLNDNLLEWLHITYTGTIERTKKQHRRRVYTQDFSRFPFCVGKVTLPWLCLHGETIADRIFARKRKVEGGRVGVYGSELLFFCVLSVCLIRRFHLYRFPLFILWSLARKAHKLRTEMVCCHSGGKERRKNGYRRENSFQRVAALD